MASYIVVPARYQSSRLPGKPLADIRGRPMLLRVLDVVATLSVDGLYAAVDDERVATVVREAGYIPVMTGSGHASGSDRIMEVADLKRWRDDDVIVNVQGDEPLLPSELVVRLLEYMQSQTAIQFASVSEPLEEEDFKNPNAVKVVTASSGKALYFSRAPIPFPRDGGAVRAKRHVGIYAYRVAALRRFTSLPASMLERTEQLEQLRWLEAGHDIHMLHYPAKVPGGVDTPEDLARVCARFDDVSS